MLFYKGLKQAELMRAIAADILPLEVDNVLALPQNTQDGSYFLEDNMIAVNVDFRASFTSMPIVRRSSIG